jgi:hypothetical protein
MGMEETEKNQFWGPLVLRLGLGHPQRTMTGKTTIWRDADVLGGMILRFVSFVLASAHLASVVESMFGPKKAFRLFERLMSGLCIFRGFLLPETKKRRNNARSCSVTVC